MNSRVTVWLQEFFTFFKPETLFIDIMRFLQGRMHETVLSALSNDGSFCIVVESDLGKILYDKKSVKIGKNVIEQVEFIPRCGNGFSFTLVDNELSIVRRNGSDPEYSPKISEKEMAEISVFISALRDKTNEFFRTRT